MKRFILAVMICSVAGAPIAAQEGTAEAPATTPAAPATMARLNLRNFTFADTSTQTPPPRPVIQPAGGGYTGTEKTLYGISLATAAGGTVYNIMKTREALDRKLEARTFPLVWVKTSDPQDKNKMTAIIAGVNGALMVVSAIAFKKHDTVAATLLNFLVGGATIAVALHDRSIINTDKQNCPVVSACR